MSAINRKNKFPESSLIGSVKKNELSNKEIEILKLLKEENKYKETFKQYLTSNENMISISNEVNNYIEKMPIDKY